MTTAPATALRRLRPSTGTLRWAVPLLVVELAAILVYAARPDLTVLTPRYLLLPFVWINLAIWAVVRRSPPRSASPRATAVAASAAAGYFLVLAVVGGLLSFGPLPEHAEPGFRIATSLPPGWAPMLSFTGDGVQVTAMLYKLVGYAALAYLVGVTLLDAAGAALSGVVGLFSCVSCAWPVIGTVVSAVFGGSSAVAAVAMDQAYLLSTAVYVSAVLLLVWSPELTQRLARYLSGASG